MLVVRCLLFVVCWFCLLSAGPCGLVIVACCVSVCCCLLFVVSSLFVVRCLVSVLLMFVGFCVLRLLLAVCVLRFVRRRSSSFVACWLLVVVCVVRCSLLVAV